MHLLKWFTVATIGLGLSVDLIAQEVVDQYRFDKGGKVVSLMTNMNIQDDPAHLLNVPIRVNGRKQDTVLEVTADGREDGDAPIPVKVVSPAGYEGRTFFVYPRWLKEGVKVDSNNPEDLRKRADALLRPPNPSCPAIPPAIPEKKAGRSLAARGMDKAINVFYQDCRASSVVVKGLYPNLSEHVNVDTVGASNRKIRSVKPDRVKNYIAEHPVLRSLSLPENSPAQNQCLDQLKNPKNGLVPIYGWGAKGIMTDHNPPRIDITRNQGPVPVSGVSNERPYASLDCSSLVSVALRGAGLNLSPGNPPSPGMGTYDIDKAIKRSDSCLEVPTFKEGKGLTNGDIINVGGLHVVMVDSVGPDPFGLDGVTSKGKCEEAAHDVAKWDFRIAHSASVEHMGVHKVEASVYFSNGETKGRKFYTLVTDWVKTLCINKFNRKNTSGKISNTTNTLMIARHQSNKDGCSFSPKPSFESESCIENCKNI